MSRLKKVQNKLKRYDKYLFIKKSIDGSSVICRQSPFNASVDYELFVIRNEYIGNWVIDKIKSMDTRKFDIISRVRYNNKKIQDGGNHNYSKEIASFINNNGITVL